MFHSRRIGLNDGEPVRILGGARLVGRVGKTDVGILNMQTASEDGLPSENVGVVRLRRQVFNSFSNVGGMATTRFADDGTYNIAVGADAIVRPFGSEYVTLKLVQTFDDTDVPGQGFFDAGRFVAMWQRRNENGFSYIGEFIRSGADYNAGIGFQTRSDFTFLNNELQYKRFTSAESPLRTVELVNKSQTYLRNSDNSAESGSIEPQLALEFKSQARIRLSVTNSYESVLTPFLIPGDLNIPSGDYWFHEGRLRLQSPRGATKHGTLTVGTGSFYDGWRTNVILEPEWRVSPHFTIDGQYEINIIRFSERNESIDSHLVRLRINAALDTHFSANLLTQYNSADDDVGINARLRYHFSEGNDLWLVYNEGFNTNRDVFTGPRLPLSQSRAFMVKYTYTFID